MAEDVVELANVSLPQLLEDLRGEYAQVDQLVRRSGDRDRVTPADGWGIRDTIAHLVQGEELATLAASHPDRFRSELGRLLEDLGATLQEFERWAASAVLGDLVTRWSEVRSRLLDALSSFASADRIPWVTGDMSAASFARSRLMEAWAHGLDIADAVGATREEADERLRHVVYLGVRTRGFSFRNRGLDEPTVPVLVELTAPSGRTWQHGDATASEVVRGPAVDFAAVVTQRRHPGDTTLDVDGGAAQQWMEVAQCFAGPPTDHRPAGSFVDGRWVARPS